MGCGAALGFGAAWLLECTGFGTAGWAGGATDVCVGAAEWLGAALVLARELDGGDEVGAALVDEAADVLTSDGDMLCVDVGASSATGAADLSAPARAIPMTTSAHAATVAAASDVLTTRPAPM